MKISHETQEQTHQRLTGVIAKADFHVLDGTYAFEEFPHRDLSRRARADALALVRDHDVWSQLAPSKDRKRELCTVFSFHFEAGIDNSGFVGWLASHLKARLGTGIFVICGSNIHRGGIFDYWGCPAEAGTRVIAEIRKLRDQT